MRIDLQYRLQSSRDAEYLDWLYFSWDSNFAGGLLPRCDHVTFTASLRRPNLAGI